MKSLLRKADWRVLLLALAVGGMLAGLSVARYRGYNAGMNDLGNMSQAIWSGTQGQPLVVTSDHGPLSRLALHVELFYFLLVPLYALFPSPVTLLIFQAAMFAAGAFPLYALARRRLASISAALAITATYLFYPVAQTAVLFDFHGDTLAMPLLLFAIEALDRHAWRRYALWLLLALTCKFYVAVAVVVLGVVLWLLGQHQAGRLTIFVGLIWLGFVLIVIRPWFAVSSNSHLPVTFLDYLQFYFGGLGLQLLGTLLPRILTAVVIFLPGLWLGRYAWRWCLPAFAIAVPALLSLGDVSAYDYRFHHYALTVPFLIVALIYGAEELRRRQRLRHYRRSWRGEVFLTLGIIIVFNVGLVDTPLNPQFWSGKPGWGINQWRYGHTSRDTFKDHWLRENVPARVPLAASEFLAPHLTNRETLYLVRYPDELKMLGQPDHLRQTFYLMQHPNALPDLLLTKHLNEVDYVVADALYDYTLPFGEDLMIGGVLHDLPGIMAVMQEPEFGLLTARDGLLLFGRVPDSTRVLTQAVTVGGVATDPQMCFAGQLCLLSAEIEPRGGRRFLLRYRWVATPALNARAPLLAVSRLEGVDHSRVVHLPTLALHPTLAWEAGQVVEETFEVVWPEEILAGDYRLLTGWCDGGDPFAAATDVQSRVGEEVCVGTVALH